MVYKNALNKMAEKIGDMFRGETFGFYPIMKDGARAADPLQKFFDGYGISYARKDILVDKNEDGRAKKKLVTSPNELFKGMRTVLIFDEPVIEGGTIMSGYAGIVAYRDVLGVDRIVLASRTDEAGVTDICCEPFYLTLHGKGRVHRRDYVKGEWPRIYRQIERDLHEIGRNRISINHDEILGFSSPPKHSISDLTAELFDILVETVRLRLNSSVFPLCKRESPYRKRLRDAAEGIKRLTDKAAVL
jgi:hypothetical protein